MGCGCCEDGGAAAVLELGFRGSLGQEPETVQELVSQATSAFLEWLSEEWILAPGGKGEVERARVEVFRDWYGPHWSVRFSMEGPPWFGDSVTLEMEEIAPGEFQALITEPQFFHLRNIECVHSGCAPQGHWRLNPAPSRGLQAFSQATMAIPQVRPMGWSRSRRWPPRGESPCFTERPRDLGWADSRHWMEED